MQLADSTVFTRCPGFSSYPSVPLRWISQKTKHLHTILFAVLTSAVHCAANRRHSEFVRGLQNGGR